MLQVNTTYHCTPKQWSKWLPLAEWWYNTTYHSAIHITPYRVVYGQHPPLHLPYLPGDSAVEAIDRSLQAREAAIRLLKFHLQGAQNRMKQQAEKKRSDRCFAVGDFGFVKLQPYGQKSAVNRLCLKLSAKYFGPYNVLSMTGSVAYRLELPPEAKIHPVFHVSQLKKYAGAQPVQLQLPLLTDEGLFIKEPVAVVDRRLNQRKGKAVT